jgi:hypothetical protein
MSMSESKLIGVFFGFVVAVVAVVLLTGGLATSSPAAGGVGAGALQAFAKTPTTNTSQNFSFTSPSPSWGSGNLCHPTTSNSYVNCTYSGSGSHGGFGAVQSGCGCKTPTPLTYNFSGAYLHFVVIISNTNNQPVYLNFGGHNDTILIELKGCKGGTLNVSVLMQTTVTLNVSTSSVKAYIYLYTDADHYFGDLGGSKVTVWTYFVSARPKYNLCPSANNTKTDSWVQNITGRSDLQGYVFVNGDGYGTALNTVSLGSGNSVSFSNTTNFECSWSFPPASTCHQSWGPAVEGAASRVEE